MITPLPSSSRHADSERRHDLHPVLSAAVDCLDFELEDELARYQQMTQYRKPLESPSTGEAPSLMTAAIAPAAITVLEDDRLLAAQADGSGREASWGTVIPEAQIAPDTYLKSSEDLLRSLDALEEEPRPRQILSSLFTPLGVGLLLLVSLSTLMMTYIFFSARSAQMARQDPTQSVSEAAEGEPLSPLSPDLAGGEFTKLDLNRLISLPRFNARSKDVVPPAIDSATVDGADADLTPNDVELPGIDPAAASSNSNPNVPAAIPVVPLGPALPPVRVAPPPAPARPAQRAVAPSPAPSPALPPAPIAPAAPDSAIAPAASNPAAREPQATPRPEPQRSIPQAAPQESARESAQEPTPQNLAPQDSAAQSAPQSVPPTPQASPAQPAAIQPASPQPAASPPSPQAAASTPPPPAASDYHHVVAPYTGDRSLEEAQDAVSGAYLRNSDSGAQVQLGAFESESRAEQFVNELAEQGIDATVQP